MRAVTAISTIIITAKALPQWIETMISIARTAPTIITWGKEPFQYDICNICNICLFILSSIFICDAIFSGWWHNDCSVLTLNGQYGTTQAHVGLSWGVQVNYWIAPIRTQMRLRRNS